MDEWNECKDDSSDEESAGNLGEYLKIKYLTAFTIWHRSECSVHEPFCTLMRDSNYKELRCLTISKFQPLCNVLSSAGKDLVFPNLQKFSIHVAGIHGLSQSDIQSMKQDLIEGLLKRAPSLREIYVHNIQMLEIFPEEKYNLVKQLNFGLKYGYPTASKDSKKMLWDRTVTD